ncbi:MAG: pantetheine-phosphate adenylyltransferase [Candidatus Gottesmanbacteria bacterium]|nr:pantetheine-phosphate adenylyltransferase [Candidatus Gottesmanbacteria bacterium]
MTILNNKLLKDYLYHHIFVAGTFDGLHAGHRSILSEAFRVGERVTIGLTTDEFVVKYKSQFPNPNDQTNPNVQIQKKISTYKERKCYLIAWLHKRRYFNRTTIIPISDPHEPAASMRDLTALIVTYENRSTGERINGLRQGLALSPLALIEVPIVPAEDGKPISSTRLRKGEIDGDGRLIMPERLRAALGKPMGKILRGKAIDVSIRSHEHDFVITVGDLSTKTVLDLGVMPCLAVIDGQVGRKPFPEIVNRLQPQKVSPFKAKFLHSGPGFISRDAVVAIQAALARKVRPGDTHHAIIVNGEEDLLVLPVIQYAPLGSILYYGQPARNALPEAAASLQTGTHSVAGGPEEGIVEVVVTEVQKQEVLAIVTQFLS